MKNMTIGSNEAGQRLDKYLAKVLARAPKSFFYKMLRKKNITLNGKKASGSEKLAVGDQVAFFLSDETMEKFSREEFVKVRQNLEVIFENEEVLFINKPAGLLSQKQEASDASLVEQMISYLLEEGCLTTEDLKTFRPGICNRLDRNTSGLVAAGKTLRGLQQLSELIRRRTVHKYYLCLVKGELAEKRELKGYLCKDAKTNRVTVRKSPWKDALPIETVYEPLSSNGRVTLCRILLVTGRTHQIRSHLASIGHPVIGDFKYGDRKTNEVFQKTYGLKRQLLHAWTMEFPPLEGEAAFLSSLTVTAPLPGDFQNILQGERLEIKEECNK